MFFNKLDDKPVNQIIYQRTNQPTSQCAYVSVMQTRVFDANLIHYLTTM